MFKSGYVVIVGRPNVGKSTLMNHLIGQKIAITSRRAQTTRNRIETVLTNDEGQIIFLDTPGMLRKAGNKLGEYLMDVSVGTLKDADVILWLVEPSDFIGAGDRQIAERLVSTGKPVILVINKTDTVDKTKIGGIIEAWKKVMDFSDIVCVSALRSVNLDELTREILALREIGALSYEELSSALGLELGTVRSRLSRARKRLADELMKSGNYTPAPHVKQQEGGARR